MRQSNSLAPRWMRTLALAVVGGAALTIALPALADHDKGRHRGHHKHHRHHHHPGYYTIGFI